MFDVVVSTPVSGQSRISNITPVMIHFKIFIWGFLVNSENHGITHSTTSFIIYHEQSPSAADKVTLNKKRNKKHTFAELGLQGFYNYFCDKNFFCVFLYSWKGSFAMVRHNSRGVTECQRESLSKPILLWEKLKDVFHGRRRGTFDKMEVVFKCLGRPSCYAVILSVSMNIIRGAAGKIQKPVIILTVRLRKK
jgi:hypothetical protein